jgi:hypothetical protein
MKATVKRVLKNLNFYYILVYDDEGWTYKELSMCTYRPIETVQSVFKEKGMNAEVHKTSLDDPELFHSPVFCSELHNDYKTVDALAEDIMVSKLSGMMNKEVENL